jgi:hypothetical protein
VRSLRGVSALSALLAALVLTGGAPASSITSLEKAALNSLAKAQKAGRIDGPTASTARAEVARAAHLIRTLPNGRSYHVQIALQEAAAFREPLTLPRTLELYGALRANDDYFARHWAPADKTDIVGADGVVYRYFAGSCFRFHPLANFGVLNARVASGDADGARELADALLERGVYQRGGGIGWEYDFDFGGGRAPWLSGMAQAVAAQAFAGAAALVTDRSTAYLREATAAYRVIPRTLLTSVPAGPWIRLYAFNRLPVLNAQLQAAISLTAYATATGDTAAASLATRMRTAAAVTLPRFDTGYWSDYSLAGDPSPVDYHAFVVSLLRKLALTDARFADAAKRFASYEKQPPAFKLDNAGVGQVRFWLSKPATVTVTTGAGPTKRVSSDGGWHTLSWQPKAAGVFPVHVDAADWLGNRTSFDALPVVKVAAAAPQPARGRTTSAAAVPGQPVFSVGAAVDDPSQAALAPRLGLRLVRIGVAWPVGASAPDPGLVNAFGSLPAGVQALVELNAGALPTDPTPQAALAQYAASLAQQVPELTQLVLAPAPTAAAAPLYVSELEAVRTAVHAVSPTVAVGPLVDGGAAPKTAVAALGRAFIAAGAPQPWVDLLAFHPAPAAGTALWTTPNIAALTKAFGGTLPPIELDGVASTSPAAYAAAITSAACTPQISGVVLDRLADSTDSDVAATGLFDVSGSEKAGVAAVADAADLAQRGALVCPGLATAATASTLTYPTSVVSSVPVTLQLGCVRDCLYVATLRTADGTPVVASRGSLRGGSAAETIVLPKTTLGRSSYTLDVQLVNQVNPGPVTRLTSPPLAGS